MTKGPSSYGLFKYQIKFDEKQLKGLNLSKEYKQTSFEIKESMLGDYVDGIEVILSEI